MFLSVICTFCPGLTSNAVTSNRILSSACTVTSLGGASGAREQLLKRSALHPSALSKTGRRNKFFMLVISEFIFVLKMKPGCFWHSPDLAHSLPKIALVCCALLLGFGCGR